jgi:hypothetical protein
MKHLTLHLYQEAEDIDQAEFEAAAAQALEKIKLAEPGATTNANLEMLHGSTRININLSTSEPPNEQ